MPNIMNVAYCHPITIHTEISILCLTIGQNNSYCITRNLICSFICFQDLSVFCDGYFYVITINNHCKKLNGLAVFFNICSRGYDYRTGIIFITATRHKTDTHYCYK